MNLGPTINTSKSETGLALSSDGLELYFDSGFKWPGRIGGLDIWVTRRKSTNDDWGEPTNLGSAINSEDHEENPSISADGRELFFTSGRPGLGHIDIWVSTRQTKDAPWSEAVNLGPPVNTKYEEFSPAISPDGLSLFFSSGLYGGDEDMRLGGLGDSDIWVTGRKSRDADWEEPVNLGPPVNSAGVEFAPFISADGSTLFFGFDPMDLVPNRGNLGWIYFWQASLIPVRELLQKEDNVNSVEESLDNNDRKEVVSGKNR